MAIPPISADDITAAMARFDRDERATNPWETNNQHKYAVEYNGQQYPLKHMVADAANIPASAFISDDARNLLVKLGFNIIVKNNVGESLSVYDVMELVKERVLMHDDSLFTPGVAIWTLANIQDFYHQFVEQPDTSDNSFMDKFQAQLANAKPEVIQLAAELFYIHVLPAKGNISGQGKRTIINRILSWSSDPVKLPAKLALVLDRGIVNMGLSFNIRRNNVLEFLLDFIGRWKQLNPSQQQTYLQDPWQFKAWLFEIDIYAAQGLREVLLNLIHPTIFEPISSREDKKQIITYYQASLHDLDGPAELINDHDYQIAHIRRKLEQQYGKPFDFHRDDIKVLWNPTNGNGKPAMETNLPHSLGNALNNYIRFAAALNNDSYSAEELVERLGRMSPSIVSSKPDSAELVSDLLLLRLLEELENDRYRRWPHLSDASEDLMLRYAALTLLLPVEGQDEEYQLPILHIPRDDEAHPANEWPGDHVLLQWYQEAGIAQADNGTTWRVAQTAFEPASQTTPTAQAINTFLQHLNHVRSAQNTNLQPSDTSGELPLIDADTLAERISEIQRELLIEKHTIERIYTALLAGRHVILSGPPGTGKTHLAKILPRILWRDETQSQTTLPTDPRKSPTEPPIAQPIIREGYAIDVVTATPQWTIYQVIGGIMPEIHEAADQSRSIIYGIQHGYVTRAILKNYMPYTDNTVPPELQRNFAIGEQRYRGQWLVIDEFTRAPIDAAFGSLLTTLGGQANASLSVPTNTGDVQIPLPADFRLIGTLNSFDRHFLNQLSEAMKRRFTFIDILPPHKRYAQTEQAMAAYRALERLSQSSIKTIIVQNGELIWGDILTISREISTINATNDLQISYTMDASEEAQPALTSFWALFSAIRLYRQLGTAQAEAVYATMFTAVTVGLSWQNALDMALADVLADQLQVLTKDEQRVILALVEHQSVNQAFTASFNGIMQNLPPQRQATHLTRLNSELVPPLSQQDLVDIFGPDTLIIPSNGLFAQRLRSFINERGL